MRTSDDIHVLSPPAGKGTGPAPALKLADAMALVVGIVIGAGIFRAPSVVAANSASEGAFIMAWALGGLVSLAGALCYAELATTFPNAGGDYHFLSRAFGKRLAFLFAWARISVIQTGSIALLAFICGDFLTQVYDLGPHSPGIYATLSVILLTGINIAGLGLGTGTQKLLTFLEVSGVLLVVAAGFFFAPEAPSLADAIPDGSGTTSSLGLAMVFVLLTFGGWNEAAYVSAEMKRGPRVVARALVLGILIITAAYLLVNLAYLKALGLAGMAGSEAVAGDLMERAFGQTGSWVIGLLVAVSALTSANATIFTGARTNYALGRDVPALSALGRWDGSGAGPVNAFLVQGGIALLLVGLGLLTRKGFETMVEYTAPVFWFFFLLTGLALFILRRKAPGAERPFKVPFYPLTPLVFCLTSAYLLYSSLAYTGLGAFVGVGVLGAGLVISLLLKKRTVHSFNN